MIRFLEPEEKPLSVFVVEISGLWMWWRDKCTGPWCHSILSFSGLQPTSQCVKADYKRAKGLCPNLMNQQEKKKFWERMGKKWWKKMEGNTSSRKRKGVKGNREKRGMTVRGQTRNEGGRGLETQTVNEDQTKVNEDKLGKEKRMQEEEGGGLEGQHFGCTSQLYRPVWGLGLGFQIVVRVGFRLVKNAYHHLHFEGTCFQLTRLKRRDSWGLSAIGTEASLTDCTRRGRARAVWIKIKLFFIN